MHELPVSTGNKTTLPVFLSDAAYLTDELRKHSPASLAHMMGMSQPLAEQTAERFASFRLPFTTDNAMPAIRLFKGDVYRGLQAELFSDAELRFAQKHLRILSGLYGILRPLDLVQPYRLMIGTPYSPAPGKQNLYAYWGDRIADELSAGMKQSEVLVNLASGEYSRAVPPKALQRRIISCEFREKKANGYAVISTYAKLARGQMARFIICNKIDQPELLRDFSDDGYRFHTGLSDADLLVFTRG